MEAEEEVAQITSALTGTGDSQSWTIQIELIVEERLDFGVNFLECFQDTDRCWNLEWLYVDVLEYPEIPISRGTYKFRRSRIIPSKLPNCLWQIGLVG